MASERRALSLSNTGGAALTLSSISASGDFTYRRNTCGASLAGGASCTIYVTFTPTAAGTRSGRLTLTDNASDSPQTVRLKGIGTAVSLSAKSLSFAGQAIGSRSPAQAVTLTNKGASALSLSGISLSGISLGGVNRGDFAQSNSCGTSLAGGASCTISASFSPKGAGARTASLVISDSDPTSPQKVSLSGTGQ
jgi:hypothetical protein